MNEKEQGAGGSGGWAIDFVPLTEDGSTVADPTLLEVDGWRSAFVELLPFAVRAGQKLFRENEPVWNTAVVMTALQKMIKRIDDLGWGAEQKDPAQMEKILVNRMGVFAPPVRPSEKFQKMMEVHEDIISLEEGDVLSFINKIRKWAEIVQILQAQGASATAPMGEQVASAPAPTEEQGASEGLSILKTLKEPPFLTEWGTGRPRLKNE